MSGSDGSFRFTNVPPNPYHLEVAAPGFSTFAQDVAVRSAVPIQVKVALTVAGAQSSVTVETAGADILEVDPSAHIDVDRSQSPSFPHPTPARV